MLNFVVTTMTFFGVGKIFICHIACSMFEEIPLKNKVVKIINNNMTVKRSKQISIKISTGEIELF